MVKVLDASALLAYLDKEPGYEIVKKIEGSPTATGDRPVQPIKIQKAYVKNAE